MRRQWRMLATCALVLGVLWAWGRANLPQVHAEPLQQETAFQAAILDVRLDIEALADRVFGGGERPSSWNGPSDLGAANALANLWFDNELLANAVYDGSTRPEDWIGATTNDPNLILRNIRHDLEVLADQIIGEAIRPATWVGGERSTLCSRTVQNTLYALNVYYQIEPTVGEGVLDYCRALAAQIEDQLVTAALEASANEANLPATILAIRGDLERTADEVLGLGTRPPGWVGNVDINSGSLAGDIFTDLQLLADAQLGNNVRPPGWVGIITASQVLNARNLRFDLELLTDATLGEGVRPRGWQGTDPIIRCTPEVQNLVLLAQVNLDFTASPETLGTTNYCSNVEVAANNLIENPPFEPDEMVDREAERLTAESQNAFSYLDVAATQYMGMMPSGTEFRAWYRNFNDSTMMFVSGDNFALFVDRRWTSLEPEVFATLPTLEGVRPLTFCDATWCNGPRATPTPTGRGPLLDVITAATPRATLAPSELGQDGKEQVSWNNIRINYLLQRPEVGTAQVTLEICRDVAQVACEPVLRLFDNRTGQDVPVVQIFNGLNVYELPYGYSTNYIIEGATLFSTDIWLNDPSLSGT